MLTWRPFLWLWAKARYVAVQARDNPQQFFLGTVAVDLKAHKAELRRRPGPPTKDNLHLAITTLDTLLGRLLMARHQLDNKAAVIIGAIGAIGGLAIGRAVDLPTGPQLVLGGLALFLAVVSVLYAIGAIWTVEHQVGARAQATARHTDTERELDYGQAIADELALAVLDTQALVITKGNRVNRSLVCAGLAVILTLLYVAAGGWAA